MTEDYPNLNNQENTPKNRRLFLPGNFWLSWLSRRQETLNHKTDSEDDEKEDEKSLATAKPEKKHWLPERLSEWFRGSYNKQVKLDLLPQPVFETASASKNEAQDTNLPIEEESTSEPAEYQLDYIEEPRAEEELGILPVSAEAKYRYDLAEVVYGVNGIDKEKIPEVGLPNIPERRISGFESKPNISRPTSTAEILRLRRERHLKRQLNKLKKQALSTRNENLQINKRQEQFKKRIDNQDRLDETLIKKQQKTDAKVGRELIDLKTRQQRLETKQVPYEKMDERHSEVAVSQEKPAVKFEQTPTIRTETIKEFVKTEAEQKPEVILHSVEVAAQRNIPIESLYERRHETKDEQRDAVAGPRFGGFAPGHSAAQFTPTPKSTTQSVKAIEKIKNSLKQAPPMYKQAAQGGFWMALMLCILALISFMVIR